MPNSASSLDNLEYSSHPRVFLVTPCVMLHGDKLFTRASATHPASTKIGDDRFGRSGTRSGHRARSSEFPALWPRSLELMAVEFCVLLLGSHADFQGRQIIQMMLIYGKKQLKSSVLKMAAQTT